MKISQVIGECFNLKKVLCIGHFLCNCYMFAVSIVIAANIYLSLFPSAAM
jgi:hypothetical protein